MLRTQLIVRLRLPPFCSSPLSNKPPQPHMQPSPSRAQHPQPHPTNPRNLQTRISAPSLPTIIPPFPLALPPLPPPPFPFPLTLTPSSNPPRVFYPRTHSLTPTFFPPQSVKAGGRTYRWDGMGWDGVKDGEGGMRVGEGRRWGEEKRSEEKRREEKGMRHS